MQKNLLRETLRSFKPYVAGKPIEELRRELGLTGRIVKLASNENPLGPSPKALAVMKERADEMALYPDDHCFALRTRLGALYGCDIEQVFAASGSAEAIEFTAQAFLNLDDEVVTSEHTFAIFSLAAQKMGARLIKAPMLDGQYRYDVKEMARLVGPQTKIVYLANPTNPTGTWFSAAEFDFLMDRIPEETLVMYDMAYNEFWTEPNAPDPFRYFKAGRRIAILCTLSKSHGLAGLRVGYVVAPRDIIQGLMLVRPPFNVSRLAQHAAIAAMEDHEFVKRSREHVIRERAFLYEGLKSLSVVVAPSQTNFLFVDTKKKAEWIFGELLKKGIIVRPMVHDGFPNAIRVSAGMHEDNEWFLAEFGRLVRQP